MTHLTHDSQFSFHTRLALDLAPGSTRRSGRGAALGVACLSIWGLAACSTLERDSDLGAFGSTGVGTGVDPDGTSDEGDSEGADAEASTSTDAAPLLDLGSATDETDGSDCASDYFAWDPIRPQLVFVLDASGSMTTTIPDPLGGVWTRWAALHEVVRLTLERREQDVDFGLKVFPTPVLSESDGCAVLDTVELAPMAMAMDALMQVLPPADSQPVGATPIYAGLHAAGEALRQADPTRPRALLLVADGGISSNCGAQENTSTATQYVAELRGAEEIHTFVVAIDEQAAQQTSLQSIAWAGGPGDVFDAQDGAALDAAIETVVESVRVCEIQLSAPFPVAEQLAPLIDGSEVPLVDSCDESAWGFTYNPANGRASLCDDACAVYFDGALVEVEQACEAD